MNNLLDAKHVLLNKRFWSVKTLQAIIGSWNLFVLFSWPAHSITQKIYELTTGKKVTGFAMDEAKDELGLLIAIDPLLFARIARPSAKVNFL